MTGALVALAGQLGLGDEDWSWRDDALCAQIGGEDFFPDKGGSPRAAKKVCSGCDVRAQCLKFALDNDERFGIWGGLSPRERGRLRKPRPRPVPAEPPRRSIAAGAGSTVARRRRLEDVARQATLAVEPVSAPVVEVPRERPGVTRPWRPTELADAVRLLDDYGMAPTEIATDLHVSVARVRSALRARRGAA